MEREWVVEDAELTSSLEKSFIQGPMMEDGRRLLVEETVGRFGAFKVQVFSNEHPPPHFRVVYNGETANYSIKDCTKLNGGLGRWEWNIRDWHSKNKLKLIAVWDRTRPDDCPVGKYREDG